MCEGFDWLPVDNTDGTKTCVKQECLELKSWHWHENECVMRPSCKHDEYFRGDMWYFTCVEHEKCSYNKPWSIDNQCKHTCEAGFVKDEATGDCNCETPDLKYYAP